MNYSCKKCHNLLTEFDIAFEHELNGNTSVKECWCKNCQLYQPIELLEGNSLGGRLRKLLQMYALWIFAIVAGGIMAFIAVSTDSLIFDEDEMLFGLNSILKLSKSKLDWILFFLLLIFIPFAYFVYSNYKELGIEFFTFLSKYAYPWFVIFTLFSYLIPDNDNKIVLVYLNRINYIPCVLAGLLAFVDFFRGIVIRLADDDFVLAGSHYETTFSNGTATTRKVNDYSGGNNLFLGLTFPYWSFFYWIISSLIVSLKYLIGNHRFTDKRVVRAYRRARRKNPRFIFYSIDRYNRKQIAREAKISRLSRKKYHSYSNYMASKATSKIKEIPLPKEKIRGVLYYDIERLSGGGVRATYKKDGQEIHGMFINGEKVYDDLLK